MELHPLSVPGAWEVLPSRTDDDRGVGLTALTGEAFRRIAGRQASLGELDVTVASEGSLYGLDADRTPPGRAAFVFCPAGTVFAVVVDIRFGSDTFGEWSGVLLDASEHRGLYVPEGLAHGFLALEPGSTVVRLASEPRDSGSGFVIDPFDATLDIDWPVTALDGTVIDAVRDSAAGGALSLADAAAAGLLPRVEDCPPPVTG